MTDRTLEQLKTLIIEVLTPKLKEVIKDFYEQEKINTQQLGIVTFANAIAHDSSEDGYLKHLTMTFGVHTGLLDNLAILIKCCHIILDQYPIDDEEFKKVYEAMHQITEWGKTTK